MQDEAEALWHVAHVGRLAPDEVPQHELVQHSGRIRRDLRRSHLLDPFMVGVERRPMQQQHRDAQPLLRRWRVLPSV